MTKEEYQQKLRDLEKDFEQKKTALHIEYSLSQKKFNVGDIITNNIFTIKVEKITTYMGLEKYPMPVYNGPEYTKTLVPKKNKSRGSIFGNDHTILLKAYTNELK